MASGDIALFGGNTSVADALCSFTVMLSYAVPIVPLDDNGPTFGGEDSVFPAGYIAAVVVGSVFAVIALAVVWVRVRARRA